MTPLTIRQAIQRMDSHLCPNCEGSPTLMVIPPPKGVKDLGLEGCRCGFVKRR